MSPLASPTLPPELLQPPLDIRRLDELHRARVAPSAGSARIARAGVDGAGLREGPADPLRRVDGRLRRRTLPVDLLR